MTILNVAYPLSPVGETPGGGAEQVLTHIDRALVEAGHRSIVLACEGSNCKGQLISMPQPRGRLVSSQHFSIHRQWQSMINEAIMREKVDVVHLHGLDFSGYLPVSRTPVLVTLHLPPSWYVEESFRIRRPATYLHCVSQTQHRTCPGHAQLLPAIENGVPVDALDWQGPKAGYVAWLGRVCAEKGVHHAIAAAKRAGIALRMAGFVYPFESHQRYFSEVVRPMLSSDIAFVGPVNLQEKRRLLGQAQALLVTSTVPETSSLVAMEAMAAGTPVVAFRVGALPEIVEPGKTGYLVRDEVEMAEAIPAAAKLDPELCREAARKRFSATRMTARYLARYQYLLRAKPNFEPATQTEAEHAA
ncbi:MAG: glycosyltransferase family 4 protein [Nibricoccus sp.]